MNQIRREGNRAEVLAEVNRIQYAAVVQSILKENEGTVSKFLDGPDDTLTTIILIDGQTLHVYLDEWGIRLEWKGPDEKLFNKVVQRLETALPSTLNALIDTRQSFRSDFQNTLLAAKIVSELNKALPDYDWHENPGAKVVIGFLRDLESESTVPDKISVAYPSARTRHLEVFYRSMSPDHVGHFVTLRSKIVTILAVAAAFGGEYIPYEDMGVRE